jgi:hypothetical protein
MNYSIIVDDDLKIIRYTHTGNIATGDIGKAWEVLLGLAEFTRMKYNLLSDYRSAVSFLEVADVHLICDFLLSLESILRNKKQALIVDEPLSTALSILFKGEANKKIGFKVEVFSTEEAALEWIMLEF